MGTRLNGFLETAGRLKVFFLECSKLIRVKPNCLRIRDLIRFFPDWWCSLESGRNPLKDKRPWLAFGAIEFLERVLTSDMRVFEYGAGGSTLFFAERTMEVVTVEHHREWYEDVLSTTHRARLSNCTIRLAEAIPAKDPAADDSSIESYASSDAAYAGMSFVNYASAIDSYPEEYFDVVMIDGRARPSCFRHARRKVKKGGYLILDNAERSNYSLIHRSLEDPAWSLRDYYGLTPYVSNFSETCIWQRLA